MPGADAAAMPGVAGLTVRIESKRFGSTSSLRPAARARAFLSSAAPSRPVARAVLRDVRFHVPPGTIAALLAPSGTGKTTTLRIAAGLDTAFSGGVTRPPGRLAYVFQEPRLLPWLTVAENVRLVAPVLTDAAIDGLLAQVELPGAGGLLPAALSLGMERRVAMARALAVRPMLLAMDEPFASLDAGLAARLCRGIAARTRADGITVLMATHDLTLALAHADRILVLGGQGAATLLADLPAAGQTAEGLRARFAFLSGE